MAHPKAASLAVSMLARKGAARPSMALDADPELRSQYPAGDIADEQAETAERPARQDGPGAGQSESSTAGDETPDIESDESADVPRDAMVAPGRSEARTAGVPEAKLRASDLKRGRLTDELLRVVTVARAPTASPCAPAATTDVSAPAEPAANEDAESAANEDAEAAAKEDTATVQADDVPASEQSAPSASVETIPAAAATTDTAERPSIAEAHGAERQPREPRLAGSTDEPERGRGPAAGAPPRSDAPGRAEPILVSTVERAPPSGLPAGGAPEAAERPATAPAGGTQSAPAGTALPRAVPSIPSAKAPTAPSGDKDFTDKASSDDTTTKISAEDGETAAPRLPAAPGVPYPATPGTAAPRPRPQATPRAGARATAPGARRAPTAAHPISRASPLSKPSRRRRVRRTPWIVAGLTAAAAAALAVWLIPGEDGGPPSDAAQTPRATATATRAVEPVPVAQSGARREDATLADDPASDAGRGTAASTDSVAEPGRVWSAPSPPADGIKPPPRPPLTSEPVIEASVGPAPSVGEHAGELPRTAPQADRAAHGADGDPDTTGDAPPAAATDIASLPADREDASVPAATDALPADDRSAARNLLPEVDRAGIERVSTTTARDALGILTPAVDVIRIDDGGSAVLAGRGPANREFIILHNDEPIGVVTIDTRGNWVFLPAKPLPDGPHEISLVPKAPSQSVQLPPVRKDDPPRPGSDAGIESVSDGGAKLAPPRPQGTPRPLRKPNVPEARAETSPARPVSASHVVRVAD